MSNRFRLAVLLATMCLPALAAEQSPGGESVSIALPGISFTRSLNGARQNAQVSAGKLTLTSPAKRDNFRDPDGKLSSNNAPVLLTEVDNRKPFTLTAQVTPTFLETYDAGALYIWVKEDLWLKMAMEMDEGRRVRMVTVRTNGTSDDNNHDVISERAVHMKISSDTRTVGFYYSVDNKRWQLIRLFRNEYPEKVWLGISAQSPIGNGTSATFENITLTANSIANFRSGE